MNLARSALNTATLLAQGAAKIPYIAPESICRANVQSLAPGELAAALLTGTIGLNVALGFEHGPQNPATRKKKSVSIGMIPDIDGL